MRTLPTSYTLSPHLLNIHPQPFTSGGFADVYHGTFNGSRVCIKHVRVYVQEAQDNPEKALKVRYRLCCFPHPITHGNHSTSGERPWCGKYGTPECCPLLRITISQQPQQFQQISDWISSGDLSKYIKKNPDADRHRLVGVPLVGSIAH